MNDDLKPLFERQRELECDSAPRWNPRWLEAPRPQHAPVMRWALAALAVTFGTFWLLHEPAPSVADFPPLLDSPSGELFADLTPISSDFLLPTHLTIQIP